MAKEKDKFNVFSIERTDKEKDLYTVYKCEVENSKVVKKEPIQEPTFIYVAVEILKRAALQEQLSLR